MKENELINRLENISKPDTSGVKPLKEIKLSILSVRKSAALGMWFIFIPCFFLFCVLMKYFFHVNTHLIDTVEDIVASIDKSSGIPFLSPLLLVGLPFAGVVINALAITHVSLGRQEAVITLKLKWLNILVLVISLCIILIFLLYLITENSEHLKNI